MTGKKLTAKAALLDFSGLPGGAVALPGSHALPQGDAASKPKTAPGAMMAFANDARSELVRENEALRARAGEADELRGRLGDALQDLKQWDGAKATRLLDPSQIVVSAFANRHAANYGGADYAALKAEIESCGGNVQPIKVRTATAADDGKPRYELVYGHRRHRACLELGLPVLAVVDNLDDRALFVEMERENRARKDLSAWEQGMMYRRALDQGLFPSNRKLAEAIGVDLSALGKALNLAALPEDVVYAFPSPLDLQFRWAKPLAEAVERDRDAVLTVARQLRAKPTARSPKAVFEQLVLAGTAGVEPFHPPASSDASSIELRVGDNVMGSIATDARRAVNVRLKAGAVEPARLPALQKLLEDFLAPGRRRR